MYPGGPNLQDSSCYVSSNAGNLRLPEEMSAHHRSVNWDVKMQHLTKLETSAALLHGEMCGG